MQLTEQHHEIRRNLSRFIANEINPHVEEWEEAEIFPAHALFRKMGDLGFLGLTKPEEYGGMGLDYSYAMLMAETLGEVKCGGVPMAIGVHTDMATPALARFGSDGLRREFLAPSIAGDFVACLGVSEPGGGSDVAAIKTAAKKDGADYVINGGKMWITNGTQADWICLLANTGEGAVHRNKSLICVPMKAKGVSIAKKIKKIGMNSSDTALIHFDDVRVPQKNRIGEEGMGFTYQMLQFQEERLWAASSAVGSLTRNVNETLDYIRERRIFGQSVVDFQAVQFRIAELLTEIEALRALVNQATETMIAGRDVTLEATMAKLKSSRLCREVPDALLQYWGGMGYTFDNPLSRAYRDGRLGSIGGGADEVMLQIIAKMKNLSSKNR